MADETQVKRETYAPNRLRALLQASSAKVLSRIARQTLAAQSYGDERGRDEQ